MTFNAIAEEISESIDHQDATDHSCPSAEGVLHGFIKRPPFGLPSTDHSMQFTFNPVEVSWQKPVFGIAN